MMRCVCLHLALIAALAVSGVAQAEAQLVSSTPADRATVAPMARIVLHFSEPVEATSSGGNLVETAMMMGGRMMAMPMNLGPVTASPDAGDPKTLILLARKPLSAGAYRLDWHATAANTQASHGAITFTVE
jgi:methionine-rich copper-binding protein CopC